MSGLHQFAGKWKEIEATNDGEMYKLWGLGKTKRALAKKIKNKMVYEVVDENSYKLINKTIKNEQIVQLGIERHVHNNFGECNSFLKFDASTGRIEGDIKIIKAVSDLKNLKEGDVVHSVTFINGDKNLESHLTFQGCTMIKIFKLKTGEFEQDPDEPNLEDLKNLADD